MLGSATVKATFLKPLAVFGLMLSLAMPAMAQDRRKSLLNSDPQVVYLEDIFEKELKLKVVKAAPVFANKEGGAKLGTLIVGQEAEVVAITDKAYRVRGKGRNGGLAGWVGTCARRPV